jgi:tripartite-type tricarboxylate transporter receptor subunit TctC
MRGSHQSQVKAHWTLQVVLPTIHRYNHSPIMTHLFTPLQRISRTGLLAFACLVPLLAQAAGEPQRPVRIVVPSAAGGTPDTLLRAITSEITKSTGQAFVIDNKPGASGLIGMNEITRAPADGLTLGYANNVTLSINHSTFKKLPYDPGKLVPVALLFKVPNVIAVNPALPIRSYAELVAYAKAHPDKLSYASPGQGTSGHLTGELLAQAAQIKLKHVPYRGSPQAVTDVLGGQVDIMIDNTPTMLPYLQQGKLRALAVTSLARLPQLPEVPTITESGLTGFEGVAWGGIVLPQGSTPDLAKSFNETFVNAMKVPQVRERFQTLGVEIIGGAPEALTDYANKETVKWSAVVKRSGIEPQ